MLRTCPHCNKENEYRNHQQFGGHISNCKLNPKREEINRKIKSSLSKLDKNKKIKFELTCKLCESEYKIPMTKNNFNKGRYRKFCSKECSSKYSSSFINDNELKKANCTGCNNTVNIKKRASLSNVLCEFCKNDIKNEKKLNSVCKYCKSNNCNNVECSSFNKGRRSVFIKFGFNEGLMGTDEFINEYNRIVDFLSDEYKTMSLAEIGEKYDVNYQTVWTLFKDSGIVRRNIKDSLKLAYSNGRCSIPEIEIFPYKSGYHITWENNKIWYRSSYELDYCKILDGEKISYEVESKRIKYYDTQKCEYRTAIPDFYLCDSKTLVEIKSSYTYDEINMNDKFKAYEESGYKSILILDKVEVTN
jgi:hypothetical protein